jgi:hypothetical protein
MGKVGIDAGGIGAKGGFTIECECIIKYLSVSSQP